MPEATGSMGSLKAERIVLLQQHEAAMRQVRQLQAQLTEARKQAADASRETTELRNELEHVYAHGAPRAPPAEPPEEESPEPPPASPRRRPSIVSSDEEPHEDEPYYEEEEPRPVSPLPVSELSREGSRTPATDSQFIGWKHPDHLDLEGVSQRATTPSTTPSKMNAAINAMSIIGTMSRNRMST